MRIDMKAKSASVRSVALVDLSPRTCSARDTRFEVVNPIDCCNSVQSLEGCVMHMLPGELIHRSTPDHSCHSTVAERHDETVQRDRFHFSEIDLRFQPVTLRLRTRWCFNPSERPQLRCWELPPHILANRLVRTSVAVLLNQMLPQQFEIRRPTIWQDLQLRRPPVINDR